METTEKIVSSDQLIFKSLRVLVENIDKLNELDLQSHRLPNRFKHLSQWQKK
jgi:hypothetical protein